jgi:hypothetical protein
MNEETKLDKLWQQAKEKSAKKYDGLLYFYGIRDEFAELIVRECLELTLGKNRKQLLDKGDLNGANIVQKDIICVINHFGVEQ